MVCEREVVVCRRWELACGGSVELLYEAADSRPMQLEIESRVSAGKRVAHAYDLGCETTIDVSFVGERCGRKHRGNTYSSGELVAFDVVVSGNVFGVGAPNVKICPDSNEQHGRSGAALTLVSIGMSPFQSSAAVTYCTDGDVTETAPRKSDHTATECDELHRVLIGWVLLYAEVGGLGLDDEEHLGGSWWGKIACSVKANTS